MTIELRFGDGVCVWKGPIKHVGVYIGFGLVAQNSREKNAGIVTLSRFSDGDSSRIKTERCDRRDSRAVVMRRLFVELIKRTPYNVFSNNCEHFKNRLLTGESKSDQLRGWMVGIACLAAVVLLSRFRSRPA